VPTGDFGNGSNPGVTLRAKAFVRKTVVVAADELTELIAQVPEVDGFHICQNAKGDLISDQPNCTLEMGPAQTI